MKKWFLIEMWYADKSASVHMVRSKNYGDACVKLGKIHGEPENFKLLSEFEHSEIDKDVLNRIA